MGENFPGILCLLPNESFDEFFKNRFFIFYQSIAEMTLLVIFPDVWLFLLFINKVI